ncbi:AAA family ATPase [Colwellia sp. MSW7]|uniref:AAA family ATPase n=1 Tax=Colwellia maritima TaxID=2912588 RepID=A0ABS9WYX1_9GAMM|nr:AAA family ATPase [Colwellia maritima]MCI2283178.1 AAA family ATPase [Colwellia maritima]
MYRNFFSLNELPFSIAPNPKYLFMSDRHREALSHLSHGLGGAGDNGGFVLLTGEVGTGKTTVSRCLMTEIPKNTQLAFILNPTLSSQELLATICDELKIRYRKTGATLKTLTDKIAEKLLKNHACNLNTLLIIDEAQHLEAEVLEQLRLLTNLETDTKKLLQVILIGQPELQQLLKRRDLRQLAQRITARYHLLPLNKVELAAYIKHRLSVAGCHRALFNKGALTAIHQLSQGIPRLINLLCHSALMEAYNSNNAVVDRKIVLKAASHALGDDFDLLPWWQNKGLQIGLAACVLFAVLLTGFWLGQHESPQQVPEDTASAVSNELVKEQPTVQAKEPLEKTNEKILNDQLPQPRPIEQLVVSSEKQKRPEDTILTPVKATVEVASTESVDLLPEKNTSAEPKVVENIAPKPKPKPKPEPEQEIAQKNYQVEAVEGVSEDLLARFQAAIDDTKKTSPKARKPEPIPTADSGVKSLTQMPAWVQEGIPSLRFEQHIYASDGEGRVNVNGRDRYEGDSIANGVYIEKILPQQVILTYRGEKFSLPLTNW